MNEYEHLKKQKKAIEAKHARKDLLNVLSKMHDQFCACMGQHPGGLELTPHDASLLGWENGSVTPYNCRVTEDSSLQIVFHS